MKRKRPKSCEEGELDALRKDPAFRALVKKLESQTPAQRDRLLTWLEEQAAKEEANDDKEIQD
jgi:hypothetical protein